MQGEDVDDDSNDEGDASLEAGAPAGTGQWGDHRPFEEPYGKGGQQASAAVSRLREAQQAKVSTSASGRKQALGEQQRCRSLLGPSADADDMTWLESWPQIAGTQSALDLIPIQQHLSYLFSCQPVVAS